MFRTPAKPCKSGPVEPERTPETDPTLTQSSSVRRSIGEWEAGKTKAPLTAPARTTSHEATFTIARNPSLSPKKPGTNTEKLKVSPTSPARKEKQEKSHPTTVSNSQPLAKTSTMVEKHQPAQTSPVHTKKKDTTPTTSRGTSQPPVKHRTTTITTKAQAPNTIPATSGSTVTGLGRVAEARACMEKAKYHLSQARNLKTEIKNDVTIVIQRLFELVRESEQSKKPGSETVKSVSEHNENSDTQVQQTGKLEEIQSLLENNKLALRDIQENLKKQSEDLQHLVGANKTYANVVAGQPKGILPERKAPLHSIAVTSESETDTGEEVLTKVRHSLAAREGGLRVERVKKTKDAKVIVSCGTEADRDKVAAKIRNAGGHLKVEEMKNRDPLLLLRSVLSYNSDEDILGALRRQNGSLFKDLDVADVRMEVRFRKKTRNPHAGHVVLRVSPQIWRRALEMGAVYIDLQRVKVEDQSPLIQCSSCLGYGHGRRFCKDKIDLCSHCGGPHHSKECPDKELEEPPQCINCKRAKLENRGHNAFSTECPIRRKWDAIARDSVSYC